MKYRSYRFIHRRRPTTRDARRPGPGVPVRNPYAVWTTWLFDPKRERRRRRPRPSQTQPARARESLASLAVRAGTAVSRCGGHHGRIRTRCVDRNLVLFPNHTPLYPIHRFPTNAPSPNVSSVHLKRPRTATTYMHIHHFMFDSLRSCTGGEAHPDETRVRRCPRPLALPESMPPPPHA